MADISVTLTVASGLTVNVSVGTAAPGGSDTYVQFNDGGSFGGDLELSYDKTTNKLRTGSNTTDGILQVTGKAYVDVEAVTFANPLICDCSKSNNHNPDPITGDTQIRLSNLSAGMSGMITLLNDGAGAHAVTFGTGFDKKGNGSDDYDATASKYNWINWYYNGVVTVYSITKEA